MLNRIKARAADERGAVLVMVAILMVVILGSAALAIDATSWTQTQRQAQNAADAAALAGADALSTGTTAATTAADSYVANNLSGATPTVTFNTPDTQVTVTVTTTGQTTLGGILGVENPSISATAVAAVTAGSACSGNGCYAIFASDSNSACTSGSAVTFNGAGDTINGGVHSNGNINLIGGSQTLNGPTTYGQPAPPCAVAQGGGNDKFPGGQTSQAPFPQGYWPDNYYTAPFTPCTPNSTCTGACATSNTPCPTADQTPSYCTIASRSDKAIGSGAANGVYCAVGAGTAANPSQYTGYINLTDKNTAPVVSATMLAGTVECGVKNCAARPFQTSYPLVCAANVDGHGATYAFTGTGQAENLTGAIFAPNGTISFNGAGSTANFLEGKDVIITGQGFTGNGPSDSGAGGSSSGSASLVQ